MLFRVKSRLTHQLRNTSLNLRVTVTSIKPIRLSKVDRVKASVPLRVTSPLSSCFLSGEAITIHSKRSCRVAGVLDRRGRDAAEGGAAGGASAAITIRGLV